MKKLHELKLSTQILIIDDEDPIRKILSESLKDEGYFVMTAADGESGLAALKELKPHICFLDIWMPGIDGLEVLKKAVPLCPETNFIMISGHGTIETAVKSTKLGAWDFIEKPLSLDKIHLVLEHALQFQSEKKEKMALLNKLRKNIAIVGESKSLQSIKEQILKVSKETAPVLICGETGTGRELAAHNIHYMSDRASSTITEIKCGSLPHELIEIELFGIEKGTLPGIDSSRSGKLELADQGTLVIEEFDEIPIEIQEKLINFMKSKSFFRMGSSTKLEADTRIILTTTLDEKTVLTDSKIHPELKAIFKNLIIQMTPLRTRPEDVYPLVQHFSDLSAKQMAITRKTISEQGIKLLEKYSWSGNVRELKNFMERVYILTPSDYVDIHDLRFAGLTEKKGNPKEPETMNEFAFSTFREARAEFEKEYLIKKIQENGGNISKTAEAIGLERSYLHRKIKSYGIEAH